jgi:N-acetylglucosaminyldiphosphoundecaprenol N-acetyl-beta-D-mannosaminyltransferase
LQEKVRILGVDIDNITEDEAASKTKELIEASNKSCKIIVAPNVEFIMQAQKDKEFFDVLQKAELATPDSIGVIIAGKLQKNPFKQRIPGQAYFRKILETAEKEEWTVYLLGGKDDIPLKAKENVEKLYPKLKIVGYHEGFFEKDSEEEVIKEINKLQPNVLFVAMGAPRQEKWIAEHQKELKVDVAAGQGGTFDYEAGNIKRAPKWIQKIGMEWFWRLILQPSRIKRMYVLPIYLFKIIFTKDMTKSKWEKEGNLK